MKKKATFFVAMISVCVIAMAGISAISTSDKPSDEPVGGVSVGKINSDGSLTVLGTFESSETIDVRVTKDEDGSMNITRNSLYYKPRAMNHTWYTRVTTPITESNNNR